MMRPLPTHHDFSEACTSISTQLRLLRFAIPPEVPVDLRKRIERQLDTMASDIIDASVLAGFSKG